MFCGIPGDSFWPLERHRKKHDAWHTLFANLLPSEALLLCQSWRGKRDRLLRKKLGKKGRDAWDFLFGEQTSITEVIAWITKNFVPAEKRWNDHMARSDKNGGE